MLQKNWMKVKCANGKLKFDCLNSVFLSCKLTKNVYFMFLVLVCDLRRAAVARAEPIAESRPNCCQHRLPALLLPHPHKSTNDDISMKPTSVFPRKDSNADLVEEVLVSKQASGNRSHLPLLHS